MLPQGDEKFFPPETPNQKLYPLPQFFANKIKAEWKSPLNPKQLPSIMKKNYTLLDPGESMFKTPKVDAAVTALQTSGFLTQDGEGSIRDPVDKKADTALRRAHEALTMGMRAATVASIVARASIVWARRLVNILPPENRSFQEGASRWLKSVSLLSDASLDFLVLNARALAATVAARRLFWLRQWQADPHSKFVVAAFPFQGNRLFGEALDQILVETRDKKKVLPLTVRRQGDRRPQRYTSHSFRTNSTLPRYRSDFRRGSWGGFQIQKREFCPQIP